MTAILQLRKVALREHRTLMRAAILILITYLLPWLGAAEAAPCRAGESVTLESEIITPPLVDGGEWFWPGKFAGTPCQVMTLRGKGALPPECVVGKRMTLTGRVIEDGILVLEVTNLKCF
ncbi:MAG: hypothetical protein K2P86_14615 [Xanthobacteraceae bacterium]|nr:hypothetical protein [Xanthobacteraceae bacterium]